MSELSNHLSMDQLLVLEYLNGHATQFLSESELARRVDGKGRFVNDPRWASQVLSQLLELHLIESDEYGRYRVKQNPVAKLRSQKRKRFIVPNLEKILADNGVVSAWLH